MSFVLFVAWAMCASRLRADPVFPEALVFKGLGLPDVINNSGVADEHGDHCNRITTIAGDLNDALTTMNFHRYNLYRYHIMYIYAIRLGQVGFTRLNN